MRDVKNENGFLIEFGRRFREIRQCLKISQKDFALKLGVSNSFISEIEYGKTKPGLLLFIKLGDMFNINPAWLLLEKGGMFLNEAETNAGENTKELSNIEKNLEKLLWYFKHSPLVKHTVMGFTIKFLHDNEEIIKRDIEVNKSLSDTE